MALLRTNTGIGTTNPTSALHVIGDVLVTGVVTATGFNGNINAGIGTVTNLNVTREVVGTSTVTDLINTRFTSGLGTITTLSGTNLTYTNSDFVNLNADYGYIATGIVTQLTGTYLDFSSPTGIASIFDVRGNTLSYTNGDFIFMNADFGYIVSGVVTDISGSRLNYTGIGTIATLHSGIGSIAILSANNAYISSGIVTSISGTNLNYTGVGTITNLNVTNSTFTNVNANNLYAVTGIVTDISGTRLNYIGVGTITTLDTDTASINNLSSDYINVGVGTVNILNSGIGTITRFDSDTATINNVTSDYINVGVATATIFNSGIGTITDFNNTRLVSGIATITNLNITNSSFTNLNVSNLYAVTGVVTDISGTRLNYTGVGTITTLDTDTASINNLSSDYINAGVGTVNILNSGIGTITDLNNTRFVSGIATITTLNSTNVISTNSDFTNLNANNAYIDVGIVTDISGTRLNYTGVGTIGTLDTNVATIDDINSTRLVVSGAATVTSLDVQTNFDVYDTLATFHNNVYIAGNLSIGGTATSIIVQDLNVFDKEITLGITTNAFGQDISNDVTANHGGISIASTVGSPLVDLSLVGFSSIPKTYKQLMWVAANSYGFGTTDAWMFNYAVGIGSTLVPDNVRLAVGQVQIRDNQINAGTAEFTRLSSGIATITAADITNLRSYNLFSQSGIITDLSGSRLNYTGFGTITNLYSNLAYIDNVSSNVGFTTAFTSERLNVTGVGTITNLNVTNSTFTNVNTNNLYAVTGFVTTLTSTNSNLTNINSTGISTLGIVTANQLYVSGVSTLSTVHAPRLTYNGTTFGVSGFVPVADGVGGWRWDSVTTTFSVNSILDGFNVLDEGLVVGTAGSITTLDFRGNNIIAFADPQPNGIATVRISDTPSFNTLNVSGITTLGVTTSTSLFADQVSVSGLSTFIGVGTFRNDLYVGGNLYVQNDLVFDEFTARNITVTGVSTLNILRVNQINSTGVVTAPTFVGDLLGVANYAHTSGFSTFSGYSNTSGFSTFSGYSNTSGFSTFSGYSNTSGFSTFSGYSNTSGFSTFSGYSNNAGIATYAWTAGVSTYSGLAGVSTSVIGGIASVSQLNVSGVTTLASLRVTGISTFVGDITASNAIFTGNVSIGGTLSYEDVTNIDSVGVITARSDVIVGAGLSVVGITTLASAGGITTTGGNVFVGNNLDVKGDINFNGLLFQNGRRFTSGIGIGSTSVNPQSGVINQRIGIGFTDLNIVGTGISVTGYGSTVVIDFGNISAAAGGALSISTVFNPRIQDITFVGGATTSRIGITTQTDRFVFDTQTGSVGIGTSGSSIPQYKLDVVGDINSSTSVKIKGVDVLEEATRLAIILG